MLASLRQSYTQRRRRSAALLAAAITAAPSSVSCSDGDVVLPDSADASHPFDASDGAPATLGDEAKDDATDEAPDAVMMNDAPVGSPDSEKNDAVEAGRVALCVRLSDPDRPVKVLDLSADVRTGYLTLVARDCTMDGLFPTRSATLAAWSNRLYDWNLDLWGCTDRAATGFALVHSEIVDLTSADAALLIDDYMLAATRVLKLSPSEATQVRQVLEQLGVAAVTRQSDDHPYARCDAGDAGIDADDAETEATE
jgi:hypothetical protein